jgi:hypothetical protein
MEEYEKILKDAEANQVEKITPLEAYLRLCEIHW